MKEAAKTAQLIRQTLKGIFPKVKFRVKSATYSMGDSVDIYYYDKSVTRKEVNDIVKIYQRGSWDSMSDSYIDDNIQPHPQVKFVQVHKLNSLNLQHLESQSKQDKE